MAQDRRSNKLAPVSAGKSRCGISGVSGPAWLRFAFGNMKTMRLPLPISPEYDSPIFEALALQIVLGLLSLLVIDGGGVAQVFGIGLVAFWVAQQC